MPRSSKPRKRGKVVDKLDKADELITGQSLPLEVQQIILNTFQSIIPTTADKDLTALIQEVKGHLFNRDFETAFGDVEYTQAYAVRWSAARALGYASILSDTGRNYLFTSSPDLGPVSIDVPVNQPEVNMKLNIICIGGGAGAEITALAATQRLMTAQRSIYVTAVDSGNWQQTLQQLRETFSRPGHLPSYASQAVRDRAENQPLVRHDSGFEVKFLHKDALAWKGEEMQATVNSSTLVTIMFTLNELFSASLPKTTAFLLALTEHVARGCHLLVVDSPGSYSEIQIGKKSEGETADVKKYPMKWLLDHTLLDVAKQHGKAVWEKVEGEDSLWFRIDQKEKARLKYPIELENMRYQLHCYRKL